MSPAVYMMKIDSKIMINNRKRNMKRKLSADIQLNATIAGTTINSGKFLIYKKLISSEVKKFLNCKSLSICWLNGNARTTESKIKHENINRTKYNRAHVFLHLSHFVQCEVKLFT